jgi:predicted amidohydrolase YtcJ
VGYQQKPRAANDFGFIFLVLPNNPFFVKTSPFPLLFCLAWAFLGCQNREKADFLLLNGHIYTANARQEFVEALAVRKGKIVAVGLAADLAARYTAAQTLDLQGRAVLPGLHDAHVHPIGGAAQLATCQLSGLNTPEQVREAIRQFAAANPTAPWVRGRGWELFVFPPDGNPTRQFLDSLVPDRPVYLTSWDGHSAWVNSQALALARVTRQTPDPPQGRIERDPRTGEPSGTLREAAMGLVARLLPPAPPDQAAQHLAQAVQLLNQLGITSWVDASATREHLRAYAQAHAQGKLTVRVVASLALGLNGVPDLARLDSLRQAYTKDEFLRANSVKIFADGVPEAHTAALLEPYADRPNDRGILNYHPDSLRRYCQLLDRAGYQLHFHALGDQAVRVSLDALVGTDSGRRHHLSHLQVIHPADLPRFAQVGALANFQPFWAKGDPLNTRLISRILGPERAKWQYPLASLGRTGARMAAGSDWPVSTVNPFEAIEVAVTRQQIGVADDAPWIPAERIGLLAAVDAYTRGGAYLMHQEQTTGSLEVGKAADLIVLDQDIFRADPRRIHQTKVLLTLLACKTVYRAAGF